MNSGNSDRVDMANKLPHFVKEDGSENIRNPKEIVKLLGWFK